ncbi:unnamed protein product [Caenorhabditis nigoni]
MQWMVTTNFMKNMEWSPINGKLDEQHHYTSFEKYQEVLEQIFGEDTPHRKIWNEWKASFPNFGQSQRERILRPRQEPQVSSLAKKPNLIIPTELNDTIGKQSDHNEELRKFALLRKFCEG